MRYLAIYRNEITGKSISFQFTELNKQVFNSLLYQIRIETSTLDMNRQLIISRLTLYTVNQLPIDYISSVFNTGMIKSNIIDENNIIQVDGVNNCNSIDN